MSDSQARGSLSSFRQKRAQWLSWFNTDEYHAICPQISAMAWNDMSFRVLGSNPDAVVSTIKRLGTCGTLRR
jgi:hypothetical protein